MWHRWEEEEEEEEEKAERARSFLVLKKEVEDGATIEEAIDDVEARKQEQQDVIVAADENGYFRFICLSFVFVFYLFIFIFHFFFHVN